MVYVRWGAISFPELMLRNANDNNFDDSIAKFMLLAIKNSGGNRFGPMTMLGFNDFIEGDVLEAHQQELVS